MDFTLTEEQALIRESAEKFVQDDLRANAGKPRAGAHASDRWAEIAALGWLSAGIPEALGGFGGPVENALLAEELGRGLMAAPLLGAAVMGQQLLIASKDGDAIDHLLPAAMAGERIVAAAVSEQGARGDFTRIETRAERHGAAWLLTGQKTLVLQGDVADQLIVSARAGNTVSLFVLDARGDGVSSIATPLVDGANAAAISFTSAPARRLEGAAGAEALAVMSDHATTWIAAESVGMMRAVSDMTAEYVKTRQQFGLPLAQFQVMQHKLADIAVDVEMSGALVHAALAAFELNGAERRRRMSGVKLAVGEALRRVTSAGVQAHGGMGMTQDYPIGRYLQRMVVLDAILGAPSAHADFAASAN